jgi:hypothetical protein
VGWRFWNRTDSVEGRIRAESGGFRAAPQDDFWVHFAVYMGILTLPRQPGLLDADPRYRLQQLAPLHPGAYTRPLFSST